jgi:uncharacterized cofD-like protein
VKVAAIGGGHGTAVTLRALSMLECEVTAIVSVADDGGSTGALREAMGIAGVGDIRKCLAALAGEGKSWADYFEHRFDDESMGGHTLGNLFLAAAIERSASLEEAVASVANMIDSRGSVIPASQYGVGLEAETDGGVVAGQVAISQRSDVRRIRTTPTSVRAPDSALRAIKDANFILLGPGSFFTSVLAACVVPGIAEAIAASAAECVWIANLMEQDPETKGQGLVRQFEALSSHGVEVDTILVNGAGNPGENIRNVRVITADVARANRKTHDPAKLALVLTQLMAN